MTTRKKPEFKLFGTASSGGGGSGEANVGANLGSGSEIYAGKTGVVLNFRTLVAGSAVSISQGSNEVAISVDPTGIDHGVLLGLNDDDHPQYLNVARHNSITGNVHGVTLDGAYDGDGGSGSGRIVTVDSGPVEFDSTSDNFAPIRLVPRSSLPTDGLGGGQLVVKDNILFVYDSSRSKFLSVPIFTFLFGRGAKLQGTQYLRVINGAPTTITGFRIPWDCTVVAMSAQTQNKGGVNVDFQIRRNGSTTNLYSLSVSGVAGSHASDVNVDLDEGDYVQVRMRVFSGKIDYPEVALFLAIRGA